MTRCAVGLIAAAVVASGCASRAKIGELQGADASSLDAGRDAARDAGTDAPVDVEPERALVNVFFEGRGFEAYDGKLIVIGVFEPDDAPGEGRRLRGRRGRILRDGRFNLDWYGAIRRGVPQRISVFIDHARTSMESPDYRFDTFTCSEASRDVMWTVFDGVATDDLRLSLAPPATTDPAACAHFGSPGDLDADTCVMANDLGIWRRLVTTIGRPGGYDGDALDVNLDHEVTSQDEIELVQQIGRCFP